MVRVRTLHPQQTFKQLTSPIFPQTILQPLTRNTFILLFNLINYDKLSYTMDIKHNKLLSDTQSTILQLLYFNPS